MENKQKNKVHLSESAQFNCFMIHNVLIIMLCYWGLENAEVPWKIITLKVIAWFYIIISLLEILGQYLKAKGLIPVDKDDKPKPPSEPRNP